MPTLSDQIWDAVYELMEIHMEDIELTLGLDWETYATLAKELDPPAQIDLTLHHTCFGMKVLRLTEGEGFKVSKA